MPFDGTDFPPRRRPNRSTRETVLCVTVVAAAFMLLLLPVSVDGFVDIVRYLRQR